tara:strand:- start:419 stop:1165 length:747 start_codon:yes stop_codon:yes gene_type:complete
MTTYFSATIGDQIHVLSDGAIYDSEGYLHGTHTKVKPLGGLPAAVMTRGLVGFGEWMESTIGGVFDSAPTVDDALATLRLVLDRHRGKPAARPLEVAIWAVSETRGPLHLSFPTVEHAGRAPYELTESTVGLVAGGNALPFAQLAPLTANGTLGDKAAVVMGALRARPAVEHSYGEAVETDTPAVGGHVDHTVICSAGVVTKTVHRFGDVIGEKIGSRDRPKAVPVLPSAGMSRAQRRAAAAQARRAA